MNGGKGTTFNAPPSIVQVQRQRGSRWWMRMIGRKLKCVSLSEIAEGLSERTRLRYQSRMKMD